MTDHAGCFRGNAAVKSLPRKLGDNAENPAYVFTDLRVGYRMPKGGDGGAAY